MKFHARCDEPLALGTRVFVIAVPTPTSVLVEPTPAVDEPPGRRAPQVAPAPEIS